MTIPPRTGPRILVSGATGQQGGAVARHLHKQGFQVRALVRSVEKPEAQALVTQGIEIVKGDLDNRASLENALTDVYGVFSVQTWAEVGTEGETRQGTTFADVAKAMGVEHFVYSSVGSAHQNTGIPHFESKFVVEEHIRTLGLPYTILRPVFLMENWKYSHDAILNGTLAQPLEPSTRLQQISTDDIGAFVALAFSDRNTWLGRAVDLAGDELTMLETSDVFSRVLGRTVHYVQVPQEQFRQAMGEENATMYAWFNDVGYQADIAALRQEYPGLTTLEQYLRRQGWQRP